MCSSYYHGTILVSPGIKRSAPVIQQSLKFLFTCSLVSALYRLLAVTWIYFFSLKKNLFRVFRSARTYLIRISFLYTIQ